MKGRSIGLGGKGERKDMTTETDKLYRFYWLDGSTNDGRGSGPADALNRLGFGGGAIRALDYYKEITDEQAE